MFWVFVSFVGFSIFVENQNDMVKVEFFLEEGFLVKDVSIEKVTESLPVEFAATLKQVIQDFISSLEDDFPPVDNFYKAKIYFKFDKHLFSLTPEIKEIVCCTAYSN